MATCSWSRSAARRNRTPSTRREASPRCSSAADSFDAHIADTLRAGAGLCHEVVVKLCVEEGPARIRMLRDIGARFDQAAAVTDGDADLDLHLEGGHSARRVAHAADMTGREVERALLEAVSRSPRIRVFEDHCSPAIDLITDGQVWRSRSLHAGA